MLIEFVRDWRNYPAGKPFNISDGMAAELVHSGVARRVSDIMAEAEMAVDHSATYADTAARRTKRRRRV